MWKRSSRSSKPLGNPSLPSHEECQGERLRGPLLFCASACCCCSCLRKHSSELLSDSRICSSSPCLLRHNLHEFWGQELWENLRSYKTYRWFLKQWSIHLVSEVVHSFIISTLFEVNSLKIDILISILSVLWCIIFIYCRIVMLRMRDATYFCS